MAIRSVRAVNEFGKPLHHVFRGKKCHVELKTERGLPSRHHGLGEPKTVVIVTYLDGSEGITVPLPIFKRGASEVLA